ncbi:uncharacterized protein LOC123545054 isoform X2 [Mercenaria mercenaria]|nr:uncharacterized protein LOC123545054 isoform X2 [Mercenaria mercenaria]
MLSNRNYILEIPLTYDSNVYRAPEQSNRISYKMCGNHGQEGKTIEKCRKVASLCCFDPAAEPCSSNWRSTLDTYSYGRWSWKKHLRYDQLLQVNFTNINIIKSWTKSALEEQSCERSLSTNDSVIEMVRTCSSTCPMTSDLIFILFSADNKTCCLRNSSSHMLQTDDCAIRNLSIVNGPSDSVIFCLAAEVINGSVYVSIEDCSRFLKDFNVSYKMVPTTTRATRTHVTASESFSIKTAQLPNSSATTLPKASSTGFSVTVSNILVIAIISVVVLTVTVAVLTVLLVKKRRTNQGTGLAEVGYVPEQTNNITSISDESGDEHYTTIQDIGTGGASEETGIQNTQRSASESLGERNDQEHSHGTPNTHRRAYESLGDRHDEEHGYGTRNTQRRAYESLGERHDGEHSCEASAQATNGVYQPSEEEMVEIAGQPRELAYDSLEDIKKETHCDEASDQTANAIPYEWVE